MKRHITAFLLFFLFSIPSLSAIAQMTDEQALLKKEAEYKEIKLHNKLDKILEKPYSISQTESKTTIILHQVPSTSEQYLKTKLFTLATTLLSDLDTQKVVSAIWKELDSNYSYIAEVTKDDLLLYQKGLINFNTLMTKITTSESIESRKAANLNDALHYKSPKNLENANPKEFKRSTYFNHPDVSVLKEENLSQQMDTVPKPYYTPFLKTLIRDPFTVSEEYNYLTIVIRAEPTETEEVLREKAYRIIKKVLSINPAFGKISVLWQPQEGAFGKQASLAGVYIEDYFNNKLSEKEFKDIIFISSLEPYSRRLNKVQKRMLVDVSEINIKKAKELRESADIYRVKEQFETAEKTYREAISYDPNDYLSYYWLGEIYIKQKEFNKAEEALETSLSINPDFRKADEILAKIRGINF